MKTTDELIKLSEEIRDAEIEILNRKESHARSETSYEIAINSYCFQLEQDFPDLCGKGKELSTIEKRRYKAEEQAEFIKQKLDMETFKRDTQMMEIMLKHKHRLFEIYGLEKI